MYSGTRLTEENQGPHISYKRTKSSYFIYAANFFEHRLHARHHTRYGCFMDLHMLDVDL